jgi:hypothetical protein
LDLDEVEVGLENETAQRPRVARRHQETKAR